MHIQIYTYIQTYIYAHHKINANIIYMQLHSLLKRSLYIISYFLNYLRSVIPPLLVGVGILKTQEGAQNFLEKMRVIYLGWRQGVSMEGVLALLFISNVWIL